MSDVTVKINGEVVNFPDQQPEIIEDRIMMPLRGVSSKLEYKVYWDESTRAVTIENPQYRLKFIIGDKRYSITDLRNSRELAQP